MCPTVSDTGSAGLKCQKTVVFVVVMITHAEMHTALTEWF